MYISLKISGQLSPNYNREPRELHEKKSAPRRNGAQNSLCPLCLSGENNNHGDTKVSGGVKMGQNGRFEIPPGERESERRARSWTAAGLWSMKPRSGCQVSVSSRVPPSIASRSSVRAANLKLRRSSRS